MSVKVKVKISFLISVAKQAKTASLHWPTVHLQKSPIVGIEPANVLSLREDQNGTSYTRWSTRQQRSRFVLFSLAGLKAAGEDRVDEEGFAPL